MEAIFANPGLYHIAELICKNLETNSFQRLVSTCKSTQNFSAAICERWFKKCQEKGLHLEETWTAATLKLLQNPNYQCTWNFGIIFHRIKREYITTKVSKAKYHPLAMAAKCGQARLVKLLLNYQYRDKIGPQYHNWFSGILEKFMGKNERLETFKAFKTVLIYISSNNRLTYQRHLLKTINDLFITATKSGSIEIKKILELILNRPDTLGHTPMHTYAYHGNAKESIELVEFTADICLKPNPQDLFGTTPMHIAVANGHFEIVKALMSNWDNIDAKNHENKTVLDIALEKGNQEMISLIQKPWK